MKVPGNARPRLDQLLVERGLVESRSRAQALVMAGKVFSGERRVVDELVEALEKERTLYSDKLADLSTREAELQQQEEIVLRLGNELAAVQSNLTAKIVEMGDGEAANFKRLSAVYGKMEPEQAASLLQEMEPERAAMILNLVQDRQAAAMLSATVSGGRDGVSAAAEWTDIIRRMAVKKREKGS